MGHKVEAFAPGTPARLLIVDDDPIGIRTLNAALSDSGDIRFATSGKSAIAMAHDWRPDLVLLDVEMPDMNGFAVCQALKADPDTAGAAVIFVTAHNDAKHETEALEGGAVDFITKPINPVVVRARVKTHLTLKRQTDELRRLSTVDSLTGVGNRRVFDATLGHEWSRSSRRATPLTLILLDIDHFKRFNDHYGHPAGDVCLAEVAAALRDQVHRPGDFLARYGGEEFAVVLPDTDPEGGFRFAERLCEAVRALHMPHAHAPNSGRVTVSLGVATAVPEAGQSPAALLAAADRALYAAKAAGRDRAMRDAPA